MKKAPMSMVERIRSRVQSTGGKREQIFYVKSGQKKRIRFLVEMDEATAVVMHDKWGELVSPCLKHFGKPCPYDTREDVRTRDNFAWSVWNYDEQKVQIFFYKANDKTPVPALLGMYDVYGSIMDRDYVIVRTGEQLDTSYSVVPMDKSEFTLDVESLTSEEIMQIIAAANNIEVGEDEDEDEELVVVEEKPRRKKTTRKTKKPAPKPEPEEEEEEEEDDDFDELFDDDEDEEE